MRAASDSSLNVMDSTPLPCDVRAHLMLKWPIHGTIVFQSCQGKVQNRAHFSAAWRYYYATVYSTIYTPCLHRNVPYSPRAVLYKDA